MIPSCPIFVVSLMAALPAGGASATPDTEKAPWADGQEVRVQAPEDSGANSLVIGLVSAGLTAGVLVWGTQAWWEDGLQPFKLRETGFAGHETYAGGADKLGHLYSSYVSMHIVAPLYEYLGVPHDRAVWFAGIFTALLWNGFEVIDGFTEFGFEYGDVVMNTLGIAIGVVTQLFPVVDSVFGMRLGYVPSSDFLENEKTGVKWINDFSGMSFYFDLKMKGLVEVMGMEPGLTRYLMGGVVYGTDRYAPVRIHEERRRSLGVHLGISFSEVLRKVGDGGPRRRGDRSGL